MPHRAKYLLGGEQIPSVNDITGLLRSEALDRWLAVPGNKAKGKEAQRKGTKVAKYLEDYRRGKTVKLGSFEGQCAINWEDWYRKAGVRMLEVECHLVNTLDRYHGSPDMIMSRPNGSCLVGDDKVKKRFADYRLLLNEHLYAACDSIEVNGALQIVPWSHPIKEIVFFTYDPDTGEMYVNEHEFSWTIYNQALQLRKTYDILKAADAYFKERATLLPSQRRVNESITQTSLIPHPRGVVSDTPPGTR